MRRIPVPGLLHVHEVAPMRMRAQLRLGLFSCELRFALAAERKTPGATRIGLVLSLANEIALAGASLDRFDARKLASEVAEQLLGAMVAFVERSGEPPPDPSSP